jgi:oxygen-independent coproporphyrinogen-3 oxidase
MDQIVQLRPENITVHTFFVKKASDILHSGVNVYSRNSREAVQCVDYSQIVTSQNKYHPYYLYRQKNTVGNLENVGFALDGHDGIYNCLIMAEEHDIYACGAGAVTKLVSEDGNLKRFYMPKYPYEYLDMPLEGEEREKIFSDILQFK